MANHLTPEELSKELGIDRQEVIRVCVEEGVPIYQGKIDKTLFQAQLEALGAMHRAPLKLGRLTRRRTLRASAASRRLSSSDEEPDGVFRPSPRATLFFSASSRSTTGASGTELRLRDLLAVELRLEHLAQVAAVLADELRRVELADEALHHLLREVELRPSSPRCLRQPRSISGLRAHVLGEEERLEHERFALSGG